MIEIIYSVDWWIRLLVYSWGFYEIGSLVAFYYVTYSKKQEQLLLGRLMLGSSVLLTVVILMLINIIGHFFEPFAELVKNTIILPMVFIGLSARFLRVLYKKVDM